jgi:hypothetical protein
MTEEGFDFSPEDLALSDCAVKRSRVPCSADNYNIIDAAVLIGLHAFTYKWSQEKRSFSGACTADNFAVLRAKFVSANTYR